MPPAIPDSRPSPGSEQNVCTPPGGSAVKAVVIGVLVDLGGSLVLGLAQSFVTGVVLAASSGPDATDPQRIETYMRSLAREPWYLGVGVTLGCVTSVLGGYACVRIARRSELKLGAIVAALSASAGLLFAGLSGLSVALSIVAATCVMLGAWVGARRNRRGQPAASR